MYIYIYKMIYIYNINLIGNREEFFQDLYGKTGREKPASFPNFQVTEGGNWIDSHSYCWMVQKSGDFTHLGCTPWKINMDHNDGGVEDHFPFFSRVICRFHVNLPGCIVHINWCRISEPSTVCIGLSWPRTKNCHLLGVALRHRSFHYGGNCRQS